MYRITFAPRLSLSLRYLHTKEIITHDIPHSRYLARLESLHGAIASILCTYALS